MQNYYPFEFLLALRDDDKREWFNENIYVLYVYVFTKSKCLLIENLKTFEYIIAEKIRVNV